MIGLKTTEGNLDISFEDTNNNNLDAIIINSLFTNKRLPDSIIESSNNIEDRGGSVGNTLVDSDKVAGTLIWYYLQNKNDNNVSQYIRTEIEVEMTKLKSEGIIDGFFIKSFVISNRNISLSLIYTKNNKQEELNIII